MCTVSKKDMVTSRRASQKGPWHDSEQLQSSRRPNNFCSGESCSGTYLLGLVGALELAVARAAAQEARLLLELLGFTNTKSSVSRHGT